MDLVLLCLFGFLAGFIDAMVGGGGLIQLPAFFIFQPHLSLVQTLASNKTASFLGTSVSAIQYIKKVSIEWKGLSVIMVLAFIGAFGGALLVSFIRKEQFMPFIIGTLLFVLGYLLTRKKLGVIHLEKRISRSRYYVYAVTVGLLIGFYEGLIGPGAGSFLIFAFVVLFGDNFLHASAKAKIVNWVASLSALVLFIFKGYVFWTLALPVAVANMAGNYVGSHLAIKKGSGFIRIFFIAVVIALIIKLAYDYL